MHGGDGGLQLVGAGRVPGDGLRMLQFRGRGQVVVQLAGAPAALRVSDQAPALVSRAHLLGWVGRVVAHELHHVLANSTRHAVSGLAAATHDWLDLTVGVASFRK